MDVFEIHLMRHPWNGCDDPRPWLIVDIPTTGMLIGCCPISTECYRGNCFLVRDSHPDFWATGLDHTSNITDDRIFDIPGNKVIKFVGVLTGGLLEDFRSFSGL
jgi:hypothetical protein